jgi:hypothetical protein
MFNTNRGIFPAYSGLGDIQVALPTPPSRSSLARDVEDLWDIHTNEPHVTAASDPGIGVPYPDDGYDPRGLPDDSDVNALINRAGRPLTAASQADLLSKLNEQYTDRLVTNLQISGMSASEIKELMQEKCAGSLLVYNGNDRDKLIQAYTLIKSLEYIVENFVSHSTFSEDAKAEMLTFVSPCPAVRDALVLPEHIIRQRLFGSTESRDSIDHALEIFELSDDDVVGSRRNPLDAEFADHQEKIDFAELELDRAVQRDMVSGDTHKAMYNALNQVLPHVQSSDVRNALTSTIMDVRRGAEDQSKRTSRSLALLMSKLKRDLEQIGVDPRSVDALVAKEAQLREEAQAPTTTPKDAKSVMRGEATSRSPREAARIHRMVGNAIQQIKRAAQAQHMTPQARVCCNVEIYTLMCLQDCCSALSSGGDLSACAANLRGAVETELKASEAPQIKPLKYQVAKSHKDLQSARKSRTMESLNRAKSESLISDKKLETLRQIIG